MEPIAQDTVSREELKSCGFGRGRGGRREEEVEKKKMKRNWRTQSTIGWTVLIFSRWVDTNQYNEATRMG